MFNCNRMKNKIFADVIWVIIILHFRFRLCTAVVILLLFFLYGLMDFHCIKKSISDGFTDEYWQNCYFCVNCFKATSPHVYVYESNIPDFDVGCWELAALTLLSRAGSGRFPFAVPASPYDRSSGCQFATQKANH